MKTIIALFILVSTSATQADTRTELDAWTSAYQLQDSHASERLSPAGGDPWLVSSSASLFTRPSFFEGIKFSNDTTDKKSTYSLTISPASLIGGTAWYLDGTQVSGAYNTTDKIISAGLKWNVDLRDLRLVSIRDIVTEPAKAFDACRENSRQGREIPDAAKQICAKEEGKLQREGYAAATRWRPSLALAIGSGYDVESKRRDKSSAILSADLTNEVGPTTLAVTVNGEWNQLPPDMSMMTYRAHLGGGAQISDTFELFRPITIAVGGKLLSCLSETCGTDSSLQVFAGVGIQVQKSIQIGLTLKWNRTGANLRDALTGGIAFSYSFTPPTSK